MTTINENIKQELNDWMIQEKYYKLDAKNGAEKLSEFAKKTMAHKFILDILLGEGYFYAKKDDVERLVEWAKKDEIALELIIDIATQKITNYEGNTHSKQILCDQVLSMTGILKAEKVFVEKYVKNKYYDEYYIQMAGNIKSPELLPEVLNTSFKAVNFYYLNGSGMGGGYRRGFNWNELYTCGGYEEQRNARKNIIDIIRKMLENGATIEEIKNCTSEYSDIFSAALTKIPNIENIMLDGIYKNLRNTDSKDKLVWMEALSKFLETGKGNIDELAVFLADDKVGLAAKRMLEEIADKYSKLYEECHGYIEAVQGVYFFNQETILKYQEKFLKLAQGRYTEWEMDKIKKHLKENYLTSVYKELVAPLGTKQIRKARVARSDEVISDFSDGGVRYIRYIEYERPSKEVIDTKGKKIAELIADGKVSKKEIEELFYMITAWDRVPLDKKVIYYGELLDEDIVPNIMEMADKLIESRIIGMDEGLAKRIGYDKTYEIITNYLDDLKRDKPLEWATITNNLNTFLRRLEEVEERGKLREATSLSCKLKKPINELTPAQMVTRRVTGG